MEWKTIDTAPKDALILLYGLLRPHPEQAELYGGLDRPTRAAGYWDEIDGAWCVAGSTWLGPWFDPTAWTDLPPPPVPSQSSRPILPPHDVEG